jgi:D-arabinose 1-dehydrogenase-like Zn-dependent alcohol dehydrogenase
MRAVQIAKPHAPHELVERPVPEPGRREVRIKVEACGICHSDSLPVEGTFPGIKYPIVPGHEVAGRVDAVGADAVRVPATSSPFSASAGWAILACNSREGWVFTPAPLRGARTRRRCARARGAPLYRQPGRGRAKVLTEMGGAKLILATVTNAPAMTAVIEGLGIDGKLLVVGASPEPIEVTPIQLLGARREIAGWPSGTAVDSEDTMRFSTLQGVKPMIETYPLEKAADAYARMMCGKARFRVVLVP